jgi:hypothetical protein
MHFVDTNGVTALSLVLWMHRPDKALSRTYYMYMCVVDSEPVNGWRHVSVCNVVACDVCHWGDVTVFYAYRHGLSLSS